MPLTQNQVNELKAQLKEQINNLPPDKKKQAEAQIDSMTSEALELMLSQQQSSQKTIFRMIIDKETESITIGENDEALAVLDINPISKGHTLIIPKIPVSSPDKIPKKAFSLAEEISKKIIDNLKATSAKAETDTQFGESIIHLIPIYNSPLDKKSPRKKANTKELQEIKISLETIKIEKQVEKIKIDKKPKDTPLKMSRRIP